MSRRDRWPRVYLLEHHVPTVALPALYKAMHALVQVRATKSDARQGCWEAFCGTGRGSASGGFG